MCVIHVEYVGKVNYAYFHEPCQSCAENLPGNVELVIISIVLSPRISYLSGLFSLYMVELSGIVFLNIYVIFALAIMNTRQAYHLQHKMQCLILFVS